MGAQVESVELVQVKSPLNTKHAVRCCRADDTNEEDIWYPSPAASCNVDTLEQRWTVSVLDYGVSLSLEH